MKQGLDLACLGAVHHSLNMRITNALRDVCHDAALQNVDYQQHGMPRIVNIETSWRGGMTTCRPLTTIACDWPVSPCSFASKANVMPRIVVRPDRLDLDSPGRRDYWLAL